LFYNAQYEKPEIAIFDNNYNPVWGLNSMVQKLHKKSQKFNFIITKGFYYEQLSN